SLVLRATLKRRVRLLNAAFSDPDQRDPDGKDRYGEDKEQLRASWEPCEPLGEAHAAVQLSDAAAVMSASAQFADEIDEFVGDRFTQRVVVDRAKRTAKVAGARFARVLLGHVRFS